MGAWRGSPGQALVEFVVLFPVFMLLGLGLIQAALLYEAGQAVQYAAFAAARAAAVGGDAHETAMIVCGPVSGLSGARVVGSQKTTVRVRQVTRGVEVEVECHVGLIVPLAGRLAASLTEESRRLSALYRAPHIALRATTRLANATPI